MDFFLKKLIKILEKGIAQELIALGSLYLIVRSFFKQDSSPDKGSSFEIDILIELVILLSIVFLIYLIVRKFIKPKIEKPINPEIERTYLDSVIYEMKKPSKEAQRDENYFYTELKAEIKKIQYPSKRRNKKSSKLNHQIEEPPRSAKSFLERIRFVKSSTTKNLVKSLQKSKDSIVIVFGQAGSGKSAALRHLAITIAQQESQKDTPRLPIYIPLGKYTRVQDGNDSPEEVIEFVKRELEGHGADIGKEIDVYIKRGRLWFLFDAMDEMPHIDHRKRYAKLMKFAETWNQNKFIFSSRKLDYDERVSDDEWVPVREIYIKQFDESQIRHYLTKALPSKKIAKKVLQEIRERKPHIFELASNPFFLSLITAPLKDKQIPDNQVLIPDNQAQIFDEFVDGFLTREEKKWALAKGEWVGDENFESAMRRIAFMMTKERGVGTVATKQFILEHFDDGSLDNLKKLLGSILEIGQNGKLLIIDESEQTLQFQHHRFQEYFTAQYLEQHRVIIESEYYDDIWWQEVIQMYASITEMPDSLVENILNDTDKIFAEINNGLPYDMRRLILDRVVLLSACVKISNVPIRADLKEKILGVYLMYFKKNGHTVEKVKSIRGFINFGYKDNLADFLKDESGWVQKSAYAEIESYGIKIKHTITSSIKKIWRFFWNMIFYNYSFINRFLDRFSFRAILVFSCMPFLIGFLLEKLGIESAKDFVPRTLFGGLIYIILIIYIVKYIRIRREKKRLEQLTSIPEQRVSVQKLFMHIGSSHSVVFRKMVISALMTTDIPEEELISSIPALAQGIDDQKFLDYLWKSVETLEKRQIRKEFQQTNASTSAEKFFKYGKTRMFAQEYEKAIKNFDKVVELQSENRMAFYFRGAAKMELRDFSGAITDLTKVIELEPDLPTPYIARADAKIGSNLLSEAIDDYSMALKIAPSFVDALVKRAALYHDLKKYEQAFNDCNHALELDPRNIAAHAIRGDLRRLLGTAEDLKGAIADYSKVLKADSRNAQVLLARAQANVSLRRYKKAIKDCAKAIELNPNYSDAYGMRGVVKREFREYVGAIEDFNKAIELDPDLALAYFHRGITHIVVGNKREGCKDLTKAKELNVPDASELINKYCIDQNQEQIKQETTDIQFQRTAT